MHELPDPTVHWSFDDGNREVTADSGPNDLHLTLANRPQSYRDNVPFSSKRGRSLRFHDLSDQYGFTDDAGLLNPGREDFSISLWFRIRNHRSPGFLISKGNSLSRNEGWALFLAEIDGDPSLVWRINSAPGQQHRAGLFIPLDPDAARGWNHVVGVIDRDRGRIFAYLNGGIGYDDRQEGGSHGKWWKPLDSGDHIVGAGNIETNSNLVVAQRSDGEAGYSGWIDDIRIYVGHAINPDQAGLLASEDFLRFDDFTERRLRSTDLISVSPVIVPDKDNAPENNRHFGWPIATVRESEIVVGYRRGVFHGQDPYNGVEPSNSSSSSAMVVTSQDYGNTWTDPFDLTSLIASSPPKQAVGGMRAIGSHGTNTFLFSADGLFKYDGKAWSHHPNAYATDGLDVFPISRDPISKIVGSRIISVEDSLCLFHSATQGSRIFVMGVSDQNGNSWRQGQWQLQNADSIRPIEPTACLVDDRIVLLCRRSSMEQALLIAKRPGVPREVEYPFNEKRSNLRNPPRARSSFPDTCDIVLNPLTQRVEVLLTNRNADYDRGQYERLTVSLWSISKTDLMSDGDYAEFHRECTLIYRRHRKGKGSPWGYDGCHVAASIIQGANQHVFFYSGYNKTGPHNSPGAGIFQLVRSLDTPALVEALD